MAVDGQSAGDTGRVRQPYLGVGHGLADVEWAHRGTDDVLERSGGHLLNHAPVQDAVDRQRHRLADGQGPRLDRLLETNGFVEEDLAGIVVDLDPGVGVAGPDELPLLPVVEAMVLGVPLLEEQAASNRQGTCTALEQVADLQVASRAVHQDPPACSGRDGAPLPPSVPDPPVITRAQ